MWRCWYGSCPTHCIGLSLAQHRHACSAAENDKVGLDQSLVRFLAQLFLAFGRDQLLTAQRRETNNESARLYETGNIEVHRIAHRRVWVADHHLTGVNQDRITQMGWPVQSASAFQHQKFTNAGMIFDHDGRRCDRSRDASRVNCRATRPFRRLNQHRALTQVQIACPVLETEGGIAREPHNGFVGKSQFSMRVLAGLHDGFRIDDTVQQRSTCRSLRMQQLHVLVYAREARFVE